MYISNNNYIKEILNFQLKEIQVLINNIEPLYKQIKVNKSDDNSDFTRLENLVELNDAEKQKYIKSAIENTEVLSQKIDQIRDFWCEIYEKLKKNEEQGPLNLSLIDNLTEQVGTEIKNYLTKLNKLDLKCQDVYSEYSVYYGQYNKLNKKLELIKNFKENLFQLSQFVVGYEETKQAQPIHLLENILDFMEENHKDSFVEHIIELIKCLLEALKKKGLKEEQIYEKVYKQLEEKIINCNKDVLKDL
jgi:hypothetical protein